MDKIPIYRNEDSELVGYIKEAEDGWMALTIFNYPLSLGLSRDEATQFVREKGLAVLLEPWEYYDESLNNWLKCIMVEVSKDSVKIAKFDGIYPDYTNTQLIKNDPEKKLRR